MERVRPGAGSRAGLRDLYNTHGFQPGRGGGPRGGGHAGGRLCWGVRRPRHRPGHGHLPAPHGGWGWSAMSRELLAVLVMVWLTGALVGWCVGWAARGEQNQAWHAGLRHQLHDARDELEQLHDELADALNALDQ